MLSFPRAWNRGCHTARPSDLGSLHCGMIDTLLGHASFLHFTTLRTPQQEKNDEGSSCPHRAQTRPGGSRFSAPFHSGFKTACL